MRRILTATTLLLTLTAVHAQQYVFPVLNSKQLYSANFGEIRPGHLHTGIDIKTDNVEGKPLVAIADGSITRLTVSASGFGRALYLTLNDGSTVVYGHLLRFGENLEQLIDADRLRRRSNNADLRFAPGKYRVRQGEVIAWSGNSGASKDPHLHIELRDGRTQRYRNLIREGVLTPIDTLRPRFMKLHYIEVDSLDDNQRCVHAAPDTYAVILDANGRYRLTRGEAIPVGRKGYFVVEVTDRRNEVNNTFGVWRLTAWIDDAPCFELRMDNFSLSEARSGCAVSYYPLQRSSRNEVIRLARMEGAPKRLYPLLRDRGLIRTHEGQRRRIRLEAEDDCGNRSQLEFDITGRPGAFCTAADSAAGVLLRIDKESVAAWGGEASLTIPPDALCETIRVQPAQSPAPQLQQGITALSPVYTLLDDTTPLRKSATVRIQCSLPPDLQPHAALAVISNGNVSHIGGRYANGVITAQTRTTGPMLIVADTIAPSLRPLFTDGADLTPQAALRFRASDNFSGISSVELTIDAEWVPCEHYPMQGLLFHRFTTQPQKKHHSVRLSISDRCGNKSIWRGTFYR